MASLLAAIYSCYLLCSDFPLLCNLLFSFNKFKYALNVVYTVFLSILDCFQDHCGVHVSCLRILLISFCWKIVTIFSRVGKLKSDKKSLIVIFDDA